MNIKKMLEKEDPELLKKLVALEEEVNVELEGAVKNKAGKRKQEPMRLVKLEGSNTDTRKGKQKEPMSLVKLEDSENFTKDIKELLQEKAVSKDLKERLLALGKKVETVIKGYAKSTSVKSKPSSDKEPLLSKSSSDKEPPLLYELRTKQQGKKPAKREGYVKLEEDEKPSADARKKKK
jgi:hypothetical protein